MAKCVIFDLDGTILDTISTITYYVNKTLLGEGIEAVTEEQCKYFAGNGARALIERALKYRGITDEAEVLRILDIYKKNYDAEPLYLTEPFHGIKEMLCKLHEEGYKLAVVSNKPDSASRPVVEHFFGDAFDVVTGAIDGVPVKPDPTLAARVIDSLGISSEDSIFVGDTYVDMETGKNLGSGMVIGVLWGFRKRDELESAGASVVVNDCDALYRAIVGE